MNKILFFKVDGDPLIWNITEEAQFKKAVMELFTLLDANFQSYADLKNENKVCVECDGNRVIKLKTGLYTCPKCDGYSITSEELKKLNHQKELYDQAKRGDVKSAFLLMTERKKVENEQWHVYEVR
jgi:ribosomal protein L37AE/L43A